MMNALRPDVVQAACAPENAYAAESGVFPLTFAQEGLWVEEQIAPGTAYNMPEAWRLRGSLDVPALRTALNALVRRHETLRTVFRNTPNGPVQVVFENGEFPLREEGLRGTNGEELLRLMSEESGRRFDLEKGPLARGVLYRVSAFEHVLLINIHHIICDAWSQAVMIRDLAEAYSAIVERRDCRLPELPVQFADYAAWLREDINNAEMDRQLDFWRKHLQDAAAPTNLIPDSPAKPGIEHRRAVTRFYSLDPVLVNELADFSRARHVTLFTTLLAAFNVLLQRQTLADEIIVGSPSAGRERVETENLIGMFVNTHPFRTSLHGDPSFLEVLQRVREATLGALSNQFVPLSRADADGCTARGEKRGLFNIVFGLQTEPAAALHMPGLQLERIEIGNLEAKFDWTLLLTRFHGGLSLRSEHKAGLFQEETISTLVRRFELLLRGILAAPEKRISEINLSTDQERQRICTEWNATARAYDSSGDVADLFLAKAKWHPDRLAVVFEGGVLTYGELAEKAGQVAAKLMEAGVAPGDNVLIDVERSHELISAIVGVLMAGGVYVPLDKAYPTERRKLIATVSGSRFLLRKAGANDGDPCLDGVKVVEHPEPNSHQAQLPRKIPRSADSPAYIMFTSGSTGTPKGAVVTHRGILRLVQNPNYVSIRGSDVFLQLAPSAFDASTFEIWGALLNGARLVVYPSRPLSLDELGAAIKRHNVSILWLTSGLFNQMVDHQLESLKGVKQLLAGGEALSPSHVRKAQAGLPGTTLINGYGPTENTTFSCCYKVPHPWEERPSVPIGRPISNSRAYVLDEHQELCGVGLPGELYVAGDGLALNYIGDSGLSSARFVTLQIPRGGPAQRLYRTGDMARWLPEGNLEFLGRLDGQVKIRGYRIEPGEIECVIKSYPGIEEAVVAVIDSPTGKRIVAYVTSRESDFDYVRLEAHCAKTLPSYMVPGAFVQIDKVPLTPNGKVDRRALPAPEAMHTAPGDIIAPRSEVEAKIAAVWQEVLGRKELDVRANFFHLGGHSLLATQVASRLSQVFGNEVPVIVLFEHPTIESLAAAMATLKAARPDAEPRIGRRLQVEKAKELLGQLDTLSEEEIDQLLNEFENCGNLK